MAFMIPAAIMAVGSLAKGEAAAGAANYNAAIARQNATIATQQGEAAAQAQQRDSARKIGAMVANYGASGIQGDAGSPMDVLADSVRMATLDNLTTKYNYQLKAIGFTNQAELDKANAKNARTSALFDAAGSLMGGYAKGVSTSGGGSAGHHAIPDFGI